MKQKNRTQQWTPCGLIALVALALTCGSAPADAATNVVATPGAMQPGGDANDTTLNFGQWFNNNGVVAEDFDTTMHSSNSIAGSIHVVVDCPGGTVTPINSANLAFGNFLSSFWGNNGWLGAGSSFDASKYESLTMDINIATTVSSNTPIPITLWGANYENVFLTDLPITTPGWQHVVIPISPTINLPNCTAYGAYFWYNTTASTPAAHVEYWFDNVKLVARVVLPPPPTLAIAPVPHSGLMFDSAPGEGGQRGAIDTVPSVPWAGTATPSTPVTYAMTVGWVPDQTRYSNYEAHIWLAPNPGVSSPDWNLSDMGYLQVLDNLDGTATARMMWKTNDPYNNTMLFNLYATNGYAAGTLGYLTAPSMVGTWSISFTSDTDFIVRGPGGVSTNWSLPADWLASYNTVNGGAVYAYFGGGPNGNANAGQPMYLSKVVIAGGGGAYALTNDFSALPLDTATWALLGSETSVVLPGPAWSVKWTLPATGFDLVATANLGHGNPWVLISGNTNLPVPVTSYTWGTNTKALVATADLPGATQNYFRMVKRFATKLQVLLPGETNAPNTLTGKIGTPDPQTVSNPFNLTINACDATWNIAATCSDTVAITSSDSSAFLPPNTALVNGTATIIGNFMFQSSGTWTVTATDVTTNAVSAGISSPITIP